MAKRFFSDDSFWNQPIPKDAETDPRNDALIHLLQQDANGYFYLNLDEWTVPVYEADATTPEYKIHQRGHDDAELEKRGSKWLGAGEKFRQCPIFSGGKVPIPDYVTPDPEGDAHMAVVDWSRKRAWDMWCARKREDGEWESNTGMTYELDGDGIFQFDDFAAVDGESIHFHGPSRAAGVPAIAGLIMYDEVCECRIRHKLSFATPFNAYKRFVFPASWTDGRYENGLPEGAVMQLDPDLDLDQFNLSPTEKAVAVALQEYGMVDVDNSGGCCIYAEGLWNQPDKSWAGVLDPECLSKIPIKHYRVLKIGKLIEKGDRRREGLGH